MIRERYYMRFLPRIRLLHPEEDPEERLESEWEELKKKTVMACIFAVIVLAGSIFTSLKGPEMITELARGSREQGEKTYELAYEVTQEEQEMKGTLTLRVPAAPVTKEEFPGICDAIARTLTERLTKEASELTARSRYLDLPSSLQGLSLSYESRTPDVIDDYGRVLTEEQEDAVLLVTIENRGTGKEEGTLEAEREITFPVLKLPYDPSPEIAGYLKGQTGETAVLPADLSAGSVSFYESKSRSPLFGILFSVFLAAVFPLLALNRYQKEEEARDLELAAAYPRFLSQFLAYLQSGISIDGCFQRVLASLSPDTYLAGELRLVLKRVRAGERPESVWEEFGRRCGRAEYRSFCTMIAQANRKGGDRLIRSLKEELDSYYLKEKNHVREKGQITGEKLLMPVGLMFVGLVLALGIPAILSITF